MTPKISPFVKRVAISESGSIEAAREEYDGACIDFAGEVHHSVPGSRLAYFDSIFHPAWRYHAAMEFDGWIHDLWYPLLPLDVFMEAIGADTVEYPAEKDTQ